MTSTIDPIYIYSLSCPETGRVRYIGKTKRRIQRKYEHCSKLKRNKYPVTNWTVVLREKGMYPIYEIIDEVPLINWADDYGIEEAKQRKSKYRKHFSGAGNPNYKRKFDTKFCDVQKVVQSKVPLRVIDTKTGVITFYFNSKEVATKLNCGHSLIRECKNNNWKARHRYIIENY